MSDETNPDRRPAGIRHTLGVIFLARLALNWQFRLFYPFLPAISRGLGVPLETGSLLLSARAIVAATSPVYGMLADRFGRRFVMVSGLAVLVVGSLLMAVVPAFGLALAACALLGLGKAAYDPAMQAYLGDAVPYAQRGRVLGLVELAWALSFLVFIPISGLLITRYGWRSPFLGIAALGALSLAYTLTMREPRELASNDSDRDAAGAVRSTRARSSLWSRGIIAALLVDLLLVLAIENVFVVYGAWLETQFSLSVAALGAASIVISIAELVAEGGVAGIADRLGLRRAVLIAVGLSLVAYLVLPLSTSTLGLALAALFFLFLAFEFSYVAMLPLVSELAPSQRGTVMAFNVAAASAGRLLATISGPRLWAAGGLSLNAAVSAGIVAAAGLLLVLLVREGAAAETPALSLGHPMAAVEVARTDNGQP